MRLLNLLCSAGSKYVVWNSTVPLGPTWKIWSTSFQLESGAPPFTYVPKSNMALLPGLSAVAPGILMLMVALSVPYRMQNLLTKCAPEKLAHYQVHASRQGTGAQVTHMAPYLVE